MLYFYLCMVIGKVSWMSCNDAGCMAALEAEHYLQEIGSQQGKTDWLLSNSSIHKFPSEIVSKI